MARRKPFPIPVRHPYFSTKCELCGWQGSSEQVKLARYWDDADCVCPSCDRVFNCQDMTPRKAKFA